MVADPPRGVTTAAQNTILERTRVPAPARPRVATHFRLEQDNRSGYITNFFNSACFAGRHPWIPPKKQIDRHTEKDKKSVGPRQLSKLERAYHDTQLKKNAPACRRPWASKDKRQQQWPATKDQCQTQPPRGRETQQNGQDHQNCKTKGIPGGAEATNRCGQKPESAKRKNKQTNARQQLTGHCHSCTGVGEGMRGARRE